MVNTATVTLAFVYIVYIFTVHLCLPPPPITHFIMEQIHASSVLFLVEDNMALPGHRWESMPRPGFEPIRG